MKCANCGNEDERTLWDEGDTVYCSKCAHRTSTETGEDDLVFALTAESRGTEKLITAEIAVQQVSDLLVRRNAESGNLYFAFPHQNRHNSFNESR